MNVKTTQKAKKPQKANGKKPKATVAKPKIGENDSDDEIPSGGESVDESEQNVEQISSEVSDLLAALRKEHGIEELPKKSAKQNKEAKSDTPKKAKSNDATDKKENKKKQKGPKQSAVADGNVEESTPAPSNDKKANKKRKLAEKEATAADGEGTPSKKAKKSKKADGPTAAAENTSDEAAKSPKKKKKDKKETAAAAETESADIAEEAEDDKPTGDAVKAPIKEHHLKNATPVFIANLPLNTKHTQLKTKCQQFGNVLAIHVRTNSGRSFMRKEQLKNVPYLIAFVYFENREDAEKCLSLNNTEYKGRVIRVDLDTDAKDKVAPKNTIVVGNLKYAVTEEILRETFECCGKFRYIRTLQCDKGCKGIAYVCFESPDSVGLALNLNNTMILGREMRVERYIVKNKKKSKANSDKVDKKPSGKGKKGVKPKGAKDAKDIFIPGKKPKKDGKKKEFSGVKSTTKKTTPLKKKKKAVVKKAMSKEKKLASKIAPKKKTESVE